MNQKEKIIPETFKPAEEAPDISLEEFLKGYNINPEKGKTSDLVPEKTEKQTEGLVDLDQETLAFMRAHSDIHDFFPKNELQTIRDFVRTLPAEHQSAARRTLVKNFKEKLEKTRKNSAKAQAEIENLIRSNPVISNEKLKTEVLKIISLNHLDSQLFDFQLAIDKFLKSRTEVINAIDKYWSRFGERWQEELFRDLFGNLPKGKIVIEGLPASIYIKIFDIEDFVFAYMSAPNSAEKGARNSGGVKFNFKFKNLPSLTKKVILENSSMVSPDYSPQVRTHEEEHATFEYYDPELSGNSNVVKKLTTSLNKMRGKVEYNELVGVIEHWALSWVLSWESRAKDEALAYLKDGRSVHTILRLLEDEDGLYNYFQKDEKDFQEKIVNFVQKIVVEDRPLRDNEVATLARETLLKGWNKYKKDINIALLAAAKLFNRYWQSPGDRLKIIRLLSQEPLNKWHRLEKILA